MSLSADREHSPGYDETVHTVELSELHPGNSPRMAGESAEHIRRISESDNAIPAIVVHRPTMRIVDGMHRFRAAKLKGDRCIRVRFFDGLEKDAFVLSVRLNNRNGLPLSRADRSMAAKRILVSHPQWSNRAVASAAGISDKTVAAIRHRSTAEIPQLNNHVGQDGRCRPLDIVAGRLRASELILEKPDLPLREVAENARVSLGTALNVRDRIHRGEHPVPRRFRPHTTADGGEGAGRRKPGPPAGGTNDFQVLCRDPFLRSHREGQAMLRMISANMHFSQEDLELFSRNLPSYCSPLLAQAARRCSEVWRHIAFMLENRTTC
ncbi:ParB/RepB/Spo0J family partition protein [Amycolatopsis sp. NPDC059021]|uniref:ParB/RepB/Spo0J family partition protein n=1 Tax=Amycolatopsis sp. NPDC059021 TaxID=3346704 RepID=UPI00366F0799